MKRLIYNVLLFTLTITTAFSQDAASIVSDYIKVIGGEKKWKSIENRRMTVDMSMQGFTFPGVIYESNKDMQRIEFDVQGSKIIQAFDGTTAWKVSPPEGIMKATPMTGPQAESAKQYEFLNEFINWQNRGTTIEFKGEETIEEKKYNRIDFTKKSGNVEEYYFDQETKLIAFTREESPTMGKVETHYSDYKDFDGMKIPTHLIVKTRGVTVQEMKFKKVEFNVEIDPSIFVMPTGN